MKDKTPFPVSPKLILKCLYISNLQDSCSHECDTRLHDTNDGNNGDL